MIAFPIPLDQLGSLSQAAAMALGSLPAASAARATEPPSRRQSIGIRVGAVSFVDEGTAKVLDILQERGAGDTIYLTTCTYGRGLSGRQIPGQPFPDHGVPESDEKTFHGGNYATVHPEFYPDIDIGIPTCAKSRKASPEDTYAAVAAALKAGADGLILSRKYSEMPLANLAAAGRAVRDATKA